MRAKETVKLASELYSEQKRLYRKQVVLNNLFYDVTTAHFSGSANINSTKMLAGYSVLHIDVDIII